MTTQWERPAGGSGPPPQPPHTHAQHHAQPQQAHTSTTPQWQHHAYPSGASHPHSGASHPQPGQHQAHIQPHSQASSSSPHHPGVRWDTPTPGVSGHPVVSPAKTSQGAAAAAGAGGNWMQQAHQAQGHGQDAAASGTSHPHAGASGWMQQAHQAQAQGQDAAAAAKAAAYHAMAAAQQHKQSQPGLSAQQAPQPHKQKHSPAAAAAAVVSQAGAPAAAVGGGAEEPLRIVIVSSEISPFSKSGGLADVSDKLAVALARLGHRVMTVAPLYVALPQASGPYHGVSVAMSMSIAIVS